jgi:DNA-binding PadR family transcriptional regulator
MSEPRLKGNLEMLLLAVLQRGSGHGYAIIRRLAESSGGRFDLPEGTVYPALHRLEHEGLVRSSWDDRGPRRRRIYALSGKGARALVASRREWDEFTVGMRAVLGGTR